MKNNKIVVSVLSLCLLSACATSVTKKELFSGTQDASQKNCYSYDTFGRNMARGMPTAVGIGIIGGLFPPLMLLGLVADGLSSVADQAALPVKCGLTLDEAVKEAQDISFYEDTTAIWEQKDGLASITVSPVRKNGECSVHKVSISRTSGVVYEKKTKNFTQNIEICKNADGVPVVTKENVIAYPTPQGNSFLSENGFSK